MTFSRVNPTGWAMYEVLTSSQMNTLDIDHANAVDGAAGGTYNPSAGLTWNNQLAVTATSHAITGTSSVGNGVTGNSTGTAAAVKSLATNGYGVIAESDTTSPARAALRLVPQDSNPSTIAEGAIYYNDADDERFLKYCDGDTFMNAGEIDAGMVAASSWRGHYLVDISPFNGERFYDVAHGWTKFLSVPNSYWVAIGTTTSSNGPICGISQDGETWVQEANIGSKNINLRGIVWDPASDSNNGRWVAVGDHDGSDAYILTAQDPTGGAWTERSNPISANGLRKITSNGTGTFVAVGDSNSGDANIARSTNGTSWSEISNPLNDNLYDVCYGNSQFVAVGGASAPKIMTSSNGSSWTSRTPAGGTVDGLRGVCYNPKIGKYIAVGGVEIQASDDGITWTEVTHIAGSNIDLTSVAADTTTGITIAVDTGAADQACILISAFLADDPSWRKIPAPMSDIVNNGIRYEHIACSSAGQFVGVGQGRGNASTGNSMLMRGLNMSFWV